MKNIFIILTFVLFLSACAKNDDQIFNSGTTQNNNSPLFSVKINGVLSDTDSVNGTLNVDTTFHPPIRQFTIFSSSPGALIVLLFTDTLNSTILTPVNSNDTSITKRLLFFRLNSSANFREIDSDLNITSVDNIRRKVSGNFSGRFVDDNLGDSIFITNGIFSNVEFTIF